jgi:hypothetical protein
MAQVSIIGTGNMANAIGGVLADGGSDVSYITQAQTGTAPLTGDIVVLAVPYPAVDSILTAYGDEFDGKTVVDITNPLNFDTFDSLTDSNGAAIVAHVSIFGTGNMGRAIARIVTTGGNSVEVFDRASSDITLNGDVVVLAVPYPAVAEIVKRHGHQLAGKIVVDITNPLNFETFDSLVVPADGSSASELAAALPGSRVLKAFNTNFAATLASGTVGDGVPTTVLVAGDDADAKAELIGLVAAGGLRGLDAGSLARARELEALGFLQLTLAVNEKVAWTGGLAVI